LKRFVRALCYIAGFLGMVQMFELSDKGRATQWVDGLEQRIRRKWIRRKLFPPLIIAINPITQFNRALSELFEKQVVILHPTLKLSTCRLLAESCTRGATSRFGLYRALRRRGSPWETKAWIRGTPESLIQLRLLLESMQLDPDKEFILLSTRDESHYKFLRSKADVTNPGPEIDPETFVRNPDIKSYALMAETLNRYGLQTIRFGISFEELPKALQPLITDYSIRFLTPERDLLLSKHCRAMMSGASGAWCFASLNNKPVAFSNAYPPFAGGVSERDRFLPQLLLDQATGQLLPFRDMYATGDRFGYSENCERFGVSLRKNSAEELVELALELLGLDDDLSEQSSMDDDLLARFQEIRESGPFFLERQLYCRAPIGLRFLRRFAHLLD